MLQQIRKLSLSGRAPSTLDSLLSTATLAGVQLYAVFGLVVGGATVVAAPPHSREQRQHLMLLVVSCLQLAQSAAQSCLVGEALRRSCLTRHQLLTKPGRQVQHRPNYAWTIHFNLTDLDPEIPVTLAAVYSMEPKVPCQDLLSCLNKNSCGESHTQGALFLLKVHKRICFPSIMIYTLCTMMSTSKRLSLRAL